MSRTLTNERFVFGSYRRADLAGTLLQKKLRDRGISLSKSGTLAVFRDQTAEDLAAKGLISGAALETYLAAAKEMLLRQIDLTVGVNEDLLRRFHALRLSVFGAAPFRARWREAPAAPHAVTGIDQKPFAAPRLTGGAVFFCLTDPAFLPDLLADLTEAERAGKSVWLLAGDEADGLLPGAGDLRAIVPGGHPILSAPGSLGCTDLSAFTLPQEAADAVERGDACLFGYGEDALLATHDLALPALICALPWGIPAKAVTGLFSRPSVSRVYVPAGFSIYPTVPLTRPTELSYYQLAALTDRFGEKAYFTSPRELALADGALFFDPYDDHLPPRRAHAFSYKGGSFGAERAAYCEKLLSETPGVRSVGGCFSLPDLAPVKPDWESREKKEQILVNGVVADADAAVRILPLESAVSPRVLFFDRKEKSRAVVSNFTFFFTDKLLSNANGRLADRPREQIRFPVGTIDYYRYTDESGRRRETLPLYRKAVLFSGPDGFESRAFELAGGSAAFGAFAFSWTGDQVNAPHPTLTVHTPLSTLSDEEKDERDYLFPVGAGRLNVAVIGERVLCARRGEVALPAVGVVFSFAGAEADRLAALLGAPDENGYFDPAPLSPVILRPDPPAGVTPGKWEKVRWAYGGGLALIDEEGAVTAGNYMDLFRRAGWLCPLSRQTQESRVHLMARHPRTAVGVTKKGELFVLVFNGRTPVSAGADYLEMTRAARLLVPDLCTLINWDGGGSSVLGLLDGDVFTEISLPAPSDGSVTGQARPVNSVLFIESKQGEKV
ncbi:MAG: phosphodiester glycosidase family protein [Clostridia bacterium]|nr:phosphodiester glycosidase family protein [Clostridia bacterium]